MEIISNNGKVSDIRDKEHLEYTIAKQAALIDYLAMMADIDLPEGEETTNETAEEN